MYPVGATISLPTDKSLAVIPVTADGVEGDPLPVVYQDGGQTTFDICAQGNTVWYRLAYPGTQAGKANIKKGILR